MAIQTRERNYRKNPHTASFLRTFHTGIGSNGRNYRAEMVSDDAEALALEAGQDDLLDLVPDVTPAYTPTARQLTFMADLLDQIKELSPELAQQGSLYTLGMTEHGCWTRENTSRWIDNLIAKRNKLRKAASTPAQTVQVADGRYAVEEDGVLKFFKVKNGRRPGFVFLDIQASDEWHSIRSLPRIRAVLALIAVDPKAAMVRYGQELGECGRTLTSEYRKVGLGPICIDK